MVHFVTKFKLSTFSISNFKMIYHTCFVLTYFMGYINFLQANMTSTPTTSQDSLPELSVSLLGTLEALDLVSRKNKNKRFNSL